MQARSFYLGSLALSGFLAACGGSDTATLSLGLTNLSALGGQSVYEGWLIVNGSPVSTGRFDVGDSTDFEVAQADVDNATMFVLSIEPKENDDPAPSAQKILAGPISGGAATLTIGHEAALGSDFSTAAGGYILETPSSMEMTDYGQGIWWLDPSAGPGASLNLPTLPAGWVYEGWVVGADGPVSTGRFTSGSGADSDAGGPAAGPEGTPPFPGQDFITPASMLNAGGYKAVISVEPEPDNGAAPFDLKPLVHDIADVAPPALQTMSNNAAASAPSGTVTIK